MEQAKKKGFREEAQLMYGGIAVTIVVIILWSATYFILKDFTPEDRGTLGDMFGTINALFSGLALAGIIFTILLQRIELKYQREELSETREEFKIQNQTLKLQRFENTFFNLLSLHHQIVGAIDIETITINRRFVSGKAEKDEFRVLYTGRDVFKYKYNKMLKKIMEAPHQYKEIYLEHYNEIHTDLGHYFRNLYRMVKLVDEADITPKDSNEDDTFLIKYKYNSIIRSQLSDFELLWIFYNCLSEIGEEKFKPLIERYSLLKNMPKVKVASTSHLELYKQSAFQNQN